MKRLVMDRVRGIYLLSLWHDKAYIENLNSMFQELLGADFKDIPKVVIWISKGNRIINYFLKRAYMIFKRFVR